MATSSFSALPAEIHVIIAKYCPINDLINLCLASKLMQGRCLPVLYCNVDFQFHRAGVSGLNNRESRDFFCAQLKRQLSFIVTLLSHPEIGKHVRNLKQNVFVPLSLRAEYAMQSLTHVQCVDLAFENFASFPVRHFPARLFQSVTAVRLVGRIEYSLAKSILNSINPATLKRLCLDLVPDLRIGNPPHRFVPQDEGEKGHIITVAEVQGLLTPLTGRFTALRTLILRTVAKGHNAELARYAAAEEALCTEWASFIRSVQGTVEKFMFEQVSNLVIRSHLLHFSVFTPEFEIMDKRFQQLVLPTIVSGNWSCLNKIKLLGIRSSNGPDKLATELRAVLGGNATIVVKEEPEAVYDYVLPYRWQ